MSSSVKKMAAFVSSTTGATVVSVQMPASVCVSDDAIVAEVEAALAKQASVSSAKGFVRCAFQGLCAGGNYRGCSWLRLSDLCVAAVCMHAYGVRVQVGAVS